ncbi:LOW QUALITY PROTEIN: hypothetical protein OSB04_029284 [Centaurea solstitialis]|uniref:DUF4371 domain-containing protein n=1 Tax=Centaurea solstitialis TaxID=347529 RepID=A0AA38SPV2_9ASTR|nr:LOW QUALITY PROTEIN: hypothetical protein OSB04_029284 [Centaurea solstitialis]
MKLVFVKFAMRNRNNHRKENEEQESKDNSTTNMNQLNGDSIPALIPLVGPDIVTSKMEIFLKRKTQTSDNNKSGERHDESESSPNRGNFLELIKLVVGKVTLGNAPGNNLIVASGIPKDIRYSNIFQEINDDVFSLLIDESSDISKKEQMVVVLRYVTCGIVQERFVGLVHVKDTNALSFKLILNSYFKQHAFLLIQRFEALILGENSSAYYVQCFAHQLQLVVVAVAHKHIEVGKFFDMISSFMNVVCASCKRTYMIRENQKKKSFLLEDSEIHGGVHTTKRLSVWLMYFHLLLRCFGMLKMRVGILSVNVKQVCVLFTPDVAYFGAYKIIVTGSPQKKIKIS